MFRRRAELSRARSVLDAVFPLKGGKWTNHGSGNVIWPVNRPNSARSPERSLGSCNADRHVLHELRSRASRSDPCIQLSAFQNVSPWICRIHGPSWTQLPYEVVENPAVRNGTTLGSANMNRLAHAEERRTGLKNNTTCLSPAPIQWFTTTWL
jgi:hypothetical protein